MKHEFAMNMSMMFSGLKFMKKDGNTDGLKPEGEDGDQSQALEEKVGGEHGEGLEDNPEENNIAVENNLTGSAFITKESNAGGEEGESPGGKPTTKGKKEKGGQSQTPSKFATGDKKGQVAKPDPKKPEEKQKAGGGARRQALRTRRQRGLGHAPGRCHRAPGPDRDRAGQRHPRHRPQRQFGPVF